MVKGIVYDILVGIVASVAGGYITTAVQKFFADIKESDVPPLRKRRK